MLKTTANEMPLDLVVVLAFVRIDGFHRGSQPIPFHHHSPSGDHCGGGGSAVMTAACAGLLMGPRAHA